VNELASISDRRGWTSREPPVRAPARPAARLAADRDRGADPKRRRSDSRGCARGDPARWSRVRARVARLSL